MPGTIYRFDAVLKGIPEGVRPGSTHSMGVCQAIEMARALGRLPRELTVYGIEGRSFAEGTRLTPTVADAIGRVVDLIVRE